MRDCNAASRAAHPADDQKKAASLEKTYPPVPALALPAAPVPAPSDGAPPGGETPVESASAETGPAFVARS